MIKVKIKKCVGVIIYRDDNKIFLMTSGKWHGKYVVPGGEILPGETEEQALIREIKEEMNIEIDNILKIGKKIKKASDDFIEGGRISFC
jgi:8-oxo-dGTP pyrophosphatase MutT (NUDIX family)